MKGYNFWELQCLEFLSDGQMDPKVLENVPPGVSASRKRGLRGVKPRERLTVRRLNIYQGNIKSVTARRGRVALEPKCNQGNPRFSSSGVVSHTFIPTNQNKSGRHPSCWRRTAHSGESSHWTADALRFPHWRLLLVARDPQITSY